MSNLKNTGKWFHLNVKIVPSHFKLSHQIKSPAHQCQRSFPTPPPPLCTHPLPQAPSGRPTFGPTEGRVIPLALYPPPPSYFSGLPSATSSTAVPATIVTTSWEGQRKVREMNRRGKGGWRAGTRIRQCVFHTLPCLFYFYLSFSFDDAACNPHAALSDFLSLSFDDAACNPHAALSDFLSLSFDDAACNPHAALSDFLSLIQWCSVQPTYRVVGFSVPLVQWHGVQPTCRVIGSFFFFPFVWRCGVQPTCHIVWSFFFSSHLTMQCATAMLSILFLYCFLLFDKVVYMCICTPVFMNIIIFNL